MTPPTKEDLQAWMKSERAGYKRAAKHFGITEAEARNTAGAPPRVRGRGKPAPADDPTALGPLAYRLYKLRQLEAYTARVIAMDKDASTGVAALSKSAEKLREQIDRLQALKPDELDDATPEQIREYLADVMIDWPNEHLELAFAIYAERHVGRVLFVSDGGHQSEFDAEEGWQAVAAE